MRLQSDPTIIYGLVGGKGALEGPIMQQDLDRQTPYNTYQINGLPPTPIANPGRASIEAVLRPAKTKDLYFVADGTGGHVFAASLEEHNRNVFKWRKVEREIRAREAQAAAAKAAQDAAAGGTGSVDAAADPTLGAPIAAAPANPGAPVAKSVPAPGDVPSDPAIAADAFADPMLVTPGDPFAVPPEAAPNGGVAVPPRNPLR
jgi:UPF0755 protein